MTDEQRKNLLVRNKDDHYPYYAYDGDGFIDGRNLTADGRDWTALDNYDFSCELAPGTYVLTAECDGPDTYLQECVLIHNASGTKYIVGFPTGAGAAHPTTFTVTDETAGTWYVIGKRRGARWRAALFAGDTPAAWAPYSGEEIAGGGAIMSANLIAGVEPVLFNDAQRDGGEYVLQPGDGHRDHLIFRLNEGPFTSNQTVHFGLSAKGAEADSDSLHMIVGYKDASGNKNWVWQTGASTYFAVTTEWKRFESSAVVPSGMTIFEVYVTTEGTTKEIRVASPTFSLGSPVSLAVASHTPYATEGHLQAKYASQEQLSSVSSQFTQTAQGFNASITTVTKALDDATGRISELKNLSDNRIGENGTFTKFYNSATSYMKFEYDENLKDSYLVLGQTDSTLSLRIGNDRIEFMDGPNVIAYVDGDKLFINNVQVVKRHMIADLEKNHGGFVFDTRDNGNMCVRWITG